MQAAKTVIVRHLSPVAAALASVPAGFAGTGARDEQDEREPTRLLFTPDEVQRIMARAATEEMKQVLKSATQAALDRGAFGAPWLW
ncbi:1ccfb226-91c5-4f88-9ec6-58a996384cfb [Thermothielavioides terrestris]|uniref:1ccfb226-91c5-4f88-9ec6-58a996384cfb n=1 Tax=Thermothielavioides terrestris TaxID=2587410 RepID=A0A3S4ANS8_9PEZI|nr:1ccfb226-91c5-4f88-9ec6-58a996384cfb [Thermothielavioides terrestris]